MKKALYFFAVLLTVSFYSKAQISVMFVNDNGVNPANTTTMLAALDQTSFSYTLFDAVAQNRSPQLLEMQAFDLVIWYTSSDGVGRWFWNGTDSDNENIKLYLQQGGWLWVIGTDFMYDRYATPSVFGPGSFMYDYLGIAEYHAQSYADDGGLGVPQLDLAQGVSWLTVNPIQWIFSTLWYVDAMTAAPGAQPIYKMGPSTYVFNQYASAVIFHASNFKVLSFYFDPALINNDSNRRTLIQEVLSHFQTLVNVAVQPAPSSLELFPNPAHQGYVYLEGKGANNQEVIVTDITGRSVFRAFWNNESRLGIDISTWKSGVYLVSVGDSRSKLIVP
jgi:hypothetical protein